jgi:hypothetical protein
MSSKLVESGEQIKMGTDRDFFIGHAHDLRRKRAKKSRPLGRENQGEIVNARRTKFSAIVTS